MRRSYFVPMTFLGILGLMLQGLFMAGCSTPIERCYTTRAVFNTGLEDANTARSVGLIDDATQIQVNKAAHAVSDALDEEDRQAIAGESFSFERVYANTRKSLNDFLLSIASAKKSK